MTKSCGFCQKTQHEVRQLIEGPRALICNECVLLCMEIIQPAEDAAAKAAAEDATRQIERRRAQYEKFQRMLESDDELEKWLDKEMVWTLRGERHGRLAVTRASAYKTIRHHQEFSEFFHSPFASDPRRPVIMRGSVVSLRAKYTIQSGYLEDVVERYMRFIRFTSIDAEEIWNVVHSAQHRAMRLYPYHRNRSPVPCGGDIGYINGEYVHLKSLDPKKLAQLKKLTAMAQKLDKFDKKRASVLMPTPSARSRHLGPAKHEQQAADLGQRGE